MKKNQKEIKGPRKVNTHAIIGKEKKKKNRKIRLQTVRRRRRHVRQKRLIEPIAPTRHARPSKIKHIFLCVCVFSSHPFWTSSSLDVPAGVTQEEGHTGFLIHLPSAVRALIFVARRIQPFLSLVDREVEFCVLTN